MTCRYRHSKLSPTLLLIVAFSAFFLQMLTHDFIVLDDPLYVIQNEHIKASITFKGLAWAFSTIHAELWHPLIWLSLMLDTQLFVLNSTGYLFNNFMLYLTNTLILFFLFPNAHFTLGLVLAAKGDPAGSIAHLTRPLRYSARFTADLQQRNWLSLYMENTRMAVENTDIRLAQLKKIVYDHPHFLPALMDLAEIYAAKGAYENVFACTE